MAEAAARNGRAARRALWQRGDVPGTPLRAARAEDEEDQMTLNLEKAVKTSKVHATFLSSFAEHANSSDFKTFSGEEADPVARWRKLVSLLMMLFATLTEECAQLLDENAVGPFDSGCNILLAKVLLRFTTGAARHMLSTEADNLDGRKLYLLLLSRYAPSWRPDTKAELIRKMVNFVFATDTMANLDKSFTALRELEKSLCEMDPHRTEVDYIEAIHVALSNTVFFEKLYTVLDFGRSHHNLHPGDYLVEMRKFLKVVLSAKAKARTAPPTGLATVPPSDGGGGGSGGRGGRGGRGGGKGAGRGGENSRAGPAKKPPNCRACTAAGVPDQFHWFADCPVLEAAKAARPAVANAVDEAKDHVDDAPEPSALAATSYWDDEEDYEPFGGVTYSAQPASSTGTWIVALLADVSLWDKLMALSLHVLLFFGALYALFALCSACSAGTFSSVSLVTSIPAEHKFQLVADSGCNTSVFRDKSLFSTLTPVNLSFGTNTGEDAFSAVAIGTVSVKLRTVSGAYVNKTFENVYYAPTARFNLLSVRHQVRKLKWCDPAFSADRWVDQAGTAFCLKPKGGLPSLTAIPVSPADPVQPEFSDPTANVADSGGPVKDPDDLQLIRSAYRYICGLTQLSSFDYDLYTDGLGPVKGNSHCPQYYSLDDPAENHTWAGADFYASPPYNSTAISSCLSKMISDFEKDPDNTSYCVILPVKKGAPWWPLTNYFQELKVWPKGTKLFTYHKRNVRTLRDLQPAGSEGGPDRFFIDGVPWDVVALYKNKHTPTKMDPYHLLHCRFGHASAKVLAELLKQNPTAGKGLDPNVMTNLSLPRHCATCEFSKKQRPGGFKKSDSSYRSNEPMFSYVVTDVKVISTASYAGHYYIIQFSCARSRFTKLYFLQSKTQMVFSLRSFLAWCKACGFSPKQMIIKSDAEAVYIGKNSEFRRACVEHGIRQVHSAPHIHEFNGIAEANWKAIGMKARALMRDAGSNCTTDLWPYAYAYANDLRNSTPHTQNDYAVPHAVVFGKQRDLSGFKVFFSQCFSHVDGALRPAFGDRAKMGFFLGIDAESGAYRILDPVTRRVYLRGRPTVVEDTSRLGKLMSAADVGGMAALKIGGDEMPTSPPPPFKKSLPMGADNPSTCIAGVSAYYDETDEDTVGLVFVQNDKHYEGFWTTALCFLTSLRSTERAYALLTTYLRARLRAGSVNRYYPLFSVVQSTPPGDWDSEGPFECVVVSVDSAADPMYRVVHAPSTGFDPGIDLAAESIDFPDPATALATGGANNRSAPVYALPRSILQMLFFPDVLLWVAALLRELDSLLGRGTIRDIFYELPKGVTCIPSKIVFDIKRNADGSIDVYKCRLVALGNLQPYGTYDETFAPVASDHSLMLLLNIALQKGLFLRQLDIRTAFLNSPIDHDIWIQLPTNLDLEMLRSIQKSGPGGGAMSKQSVAGFTLPRRKAYCKIHNGLYGLRQSAALWFRTMNAKILAFDTRLKRSTCDVCLYYLWTSEVIFLISVHVDDFAIACNDEAYYGKFLTYLSKQFEVKDLGDLSFILNMKVTRTPESITISQERMITDLALQYRMENCKPRDVPFPAGSKYDKVNFKSDTEDVWYPYRQLIGSLLWIARKSRPDIYWYVIFLSQFCACAGE